MFLYIAIACLIGLTASSPVAPAEIAEIPVPSYGFNYAVRDPMTGDNKAQTETRDGGIVRGSYSLTEPDGTLRVVDYTADSVHGFNAVVRRGGPSALTGALHSRPVLSPLLNPIYNRPEGAIAGHGYDAGFGYGTGLGHGYGAGLGHGYGAGLGHGYGAGLGHGYGARISHGSHYGGGASVIAPVGQVSLDSIPNVAGLVGLGGYGGYGGLGMGLKG